MLPDFSRFTPISGQDTTNPIPYNPLDSISQQITTSCQKSLTNLHTTYIDSYLLHSPFPTIEETLEAWHTLMKLQDEGKVRMIGMSNTYDVKILVALQKARKVQVVQNRWYEGNKWDKQVFNYCHQHEIMYQCVSCSFVFFPSIADSKHRSFWTLTGSPSLVGSPAIARIAEDSSLTPAQAVLRHAQMRGVVPLSGTTNESHMRQDLELENCSLKGSESSWEEVKQIMGD
jgi:diketogulonate reductase-like aldo/keto reductase